MNEEQAKKMILEISSDAGGRLAGSFGEEKAARWFFNELDKSKLSVRIDEFKCPRTFHLTYSTLCVCGILAFVLIWIVPLAGIVLGFVASLLMIAETLSFPLVSRLLHGGCTSRNVIGIRKPAKKTKLHIILSGHIDSAVVSNVKIPHNARKLLILMVVSTLMIAVIATLAVLTNHPVLYWAGVPFALYLIGTVALLIEQIWFINISPGAADNAAGMASLALVSRMLPSLDYAELWIIGTGAEEAGLFGMVDFLTRNFFDRGKTFIINVDQIGKGPLMAVKTEGMILRFKSDSTLLALMEKTALKKGIQLEKGDFRDMSTDACAALIRNYRALTIMGCLEHWHQKTDLPEDTDPRIAVEAAELICGAVIAIDQGLAD